MLYILYYRIPNCNRPEYNIQGYWLTILVPCASQNPNFGTLKPNNQHLPFATQRPNYESNQQISIQQPNNQHQQAKHTSPWDERGKQAAEAVAIRTGGRVPWLPLGFRTAKLSWNFPSSQGAY